MTVWVLLLFMKAGNGANVTQAGVYLTQAECQTAYTTVKTMTDASAFLKPLMQGGVCTPTKAWQFPYD